MNLLDYFRASRPKTASIAKERLQILVAHERRAERQQPAYLADLQRDLLEVVRKYVNVSQMRSLSAWTKTKTARFWN